MIAEILAAVLTGVVLGLVTGITPGLHVNMAAVLAATLAVSWELPAVPVAVFLAVMSVMHTFADCIPAVFAGAPDADTVLSILPAHRLLLKGQGYDAVHLSVAGSMAGVLGAVMMLPLAMAAYRMAAAVPKEAVGMVLLAILLALLLRERGWMKKVWAGTVVLLAAALGMQALAMPLREPLLPLFSGLFGASVVIAGLGRQGNIPQQKKNAPLLPPVWKWKSLTGMLLGGLLTAFPAIGPAQAGVLGQLVTGRGKRGFLVMLGAINTAAMVFSLGSLLAVGKGRNGSIEVLAGLVAVDERLLLLLIATMLAALPAMLWLTLRTARLAACYVSAVPHRALGAAMLLFITSVVGVLDGLPGLLVLCTATATGCVAIMTGVSRSHAMAVLMVPVALRYLL